MWTWDQCPQGHGKWAERGCMGRMLKVVKRREAEHTILWVSRPQGQTSEAWQALSESSSDFLEAFQKTVHVGTALVSVSTSVLLGVWLPKLLVDTHTHRACFESTAAREHFCHFYRRVFPALPVVASVKAKAALILQWHWDTPKRIYEDNVGGQTAGNWLEDWMTLYILARLRSNVYYLHSTAVSVSRSKARNIARVGKLVPLRRLRPWSKWRALREMLGCITNQLAKHSSRYVSLKIFAEDRVRKWWNLMFHRIFREVAQDRFQIGNDSNVILRNFEAKLPCWKGFLDWMFEEFLQKDSIDTILRYAWTFAITVCYYMIFVQHQKTEKHHRQ